MAEKEKIDIVMKSPKLKITDIQGNLTGEVFGKVKVGSILQFSCEVGRIGSTSRGSCRPQKILITDITTGDSTYRTQNRLAPTLKKITFEVVE